MIIDKTNNKEENTKYVLRKDNYDPEKPDIIQEKIICSIEKDYRYGPILRITSSDQEKIEAKLHIINNDPKTVQIASNQRSKTWAIEAATTCGYQVQDEEGNIVKK